MVVLKGLSEKRRVGRGSFIRIFSRRTSAPVVYLNRQELGDPQPIDKVNSFYL